MRARRLCRKWSWYVDFLPCYNLARDRQKVSPSHPYRVCFFFVNIQLIGDIFTHCLECLSFFLTVLKLRAVFLIYFFLLLRYQSCTEGGVWRQSSIAIFCMRSETVGKLLVRRDERESENKNQLVSCSPTVDSEAKYLVVWFW